MVFPNELIAQKVRNAPLLPGCYLYKDKNNNILYVGKALRLRDRLYSYFSDPSRLEPKIVNMLKLAADVDYLTADSELEALVLETNLIKKYRPKYNKDKKDDKNYLWIEISRKEDFPKILLVREKRSKSADYYGPFTSTVPLNRIIRMLRKVFPYRTCNRVIKEITGEVNGKLVTKIESSNSVPCLYYHLGLCQAPCAGLVTKKTYRGNIQRIGQFLRSGKQELLENLSKDMQSYAAKREYEQAKIVRDQINDLQYISQKIDVDIDTDEVIFQAAKKAKRSRALSDLVQIIGNDKLSWYANDNATGNPEFTREFKIECYDISNIQGTNAVGSMVVFVNGEPAKKLYRKFRIKTKNSPDDFAMLAEVFRRRFANNKKPAEKNINTNKNNKLKPDDSFSKYPDLIVVDGGKGQLSSTYQILTEKKVDVPIIGLAKRYEDLFLVKEISGELQFVKRTLPRGSEARFLMQRIRDEAHRFGITYHRKLRTQAMTASVLDEIPGISKLIRQKLFKAFGDVNGIKKADAANLAEIIRNRKTVRNLQIALQKEKM